MRERLSRIIVCFVTVIALSGVMLAKPAHAQMDPRVKALGAMALYGTVGGALLGTASLAFGTSGRAPAVGASLGLYAGILFGTYVVASHYYKRNYRPSPQENYYPETSSPYEESSNTIYQYADPSFGLEAAGTKKPDYKARHDTGPVWFLNLVQLQF